VLKIFTILKDQEEDTTTVPKDYIFTVIAKHVNSSVAYFDDYATSAC